MTDAAGWGPALGAVLTPGVGAALSPVPIIAVLLTLTSPGGRRTSAAFLAGYGVVLVVLSGLVLSVAGGADVAAAPTPSLVASLLQLLIGLLFAYLAWTNWSKRPRPGQDPATPGWMQALTGATPAKALRLGLLVSVVNVKNVSLAVGAMTGVAQTGASTPAAVVAALVFVVLGCAGILVPVLAMRLRPAGTAPVLGAVRTYLVANNAVIMAVLFAVLGANSLSKAVTQLF